MSERENMDVLPSVMRTLWYESSDGRTHISQADVLAKEEPVVILGEAGMGKSHLLKWLADHPGYAFCTARQLINRRDPQTLLGTAQTIVIDALDEVSSQRDGDAVDLVLRRLGDLEYPRFILSCRVADWRGATSLEAIQEQYPKITLEMHLNAFDKDDSERFLSASVGLEAAQSIIEHFNFRHLEGLLGNPQTLELIARIASSKKLPETTGELFKQAIEILRIEHRNSNAQNQLPRDASLNGAGAAFACLILTGSEAIVRLSEASASEGELQLADVSLLPGGDVLKEILGTRLFKAEGADRFSYLHRRVGEYLGAQWLAKQANTHTKRRRLLSLLQVNGLVPSSLRGIHAWLALDPALAKDVITADPMGLIEYGDVSGLTVDQAKCLIKSLEKLAVENPRFRDWRHYAMHGLGFPVLIEEIRRLVVFPETPFGLRLLMLEAVRDSNIAAALKDDLERLFLDPVADFACRKVAGEILVDLECALSWPGILSLLRSFGDELSVRLAIELIDDIGYEWIDGFLIAELVVAFAKSGSRTVGVLMSLEKNLPESSLESVLESLAVLAVSMGKHYERPGNDVLTDFVYHLVARRIVFGNTDPKLLWRWIEPFRSGDGYGYESRQKLNEFLLLNDCFRQAVQRLVILELADERGSYQQACKLYERSSGFRVSESDLIILLGFLDPLDKSDRRWRDIIQLIAHDSQNGVQVRALAIPFAAHSLEEMSWIKNLAEPIMPEWQIQQIEDDRQREAKRLAAHAGHRNYFAARINKMRRGSSEELVAPAQAYLNLYNDIEDAPAHERVSRWLGDEIAGFAHEGFEAFLVLTSPEFTAQQVAQSHANGRFFAVGYILIAALAERYRKNIGVEDLSNDRLMAGLFQLLHSRVDHHAGVSELFRYIETAVRDRGIWTEAMRIFYEPQLRECNQHVEGLYRLMRDPLDLEMSTVFAGEWLQRFTNLGSGIEVELIERLIRSSRFEVLRGLLGQRLILANEERRLNWIAIGLVVDFSSTATYLKTQQIFPELFWHIRDRVGDRSSSEVSAPPLTVGQSEWIINKFRPSWPMVGRPSGTRSGNSNAWDASSFISNQISRIGSYCSEEGISALARIRDARTDGYSELIKSVVAEQARKIVESLYRPPTLDAIAAIMHDSPPACMPDLQAIVIEELLIAQAKIKSDDAESWRGFYDDSGNPYAEERCRDHLLGILRQGSSDISYDPETHVANDKEVDITCSAGALRLPIEVKGQWHAQLWKSADQQLDTLYTRDWRADSFGIYLVLWFGAQEMKNKSLRSPGREKLSPTTPDELRDMLVGESTSACSGRVAVVVLDLTRSTLST